VLGAEGHQAGLLRLEARDPSARQLHDAALNDEILELFERSRDTYGAPRITARLRIDIQLDRVLPGDTTAATQP
jgi:hypothetical protein